MYEEFSDKRPKDVADMVRDKICDRMTEIVGEC